MEQFGWGREEGGWRKGPWTAQEDKLLLGYVRQQGDGRWNSVAKLTGLKRSGKSCRLRWVNYLRPDLKRGKITPQEESVILELHALWGNRWSTIARSLPGRTDNEIKNYWRTHFKKGKPSSKNIERARARFLKQRREIMQGHHEHQRDVQDDDGAATADNTGGGAASHHADEATTRPAPPPAQDDDDLAMMRDMADMDEFLQYDHHPMSMSAYFLLDGGDGAASDAGSSGEITTCGATWGSLWNLDDVDVVDDVGGGGACGWGSFALLQDHGLAFY
ncbi:hypothetical protein CFC21_092850 [Triticum aestivum]|uniref:Uncharacterized protein n=3 Tax=Triticinae TaxID=1648030 RepID=A0A3B6QFD8_WHEAT|nr:transcription factor MYB57-like [Aegilops tauschii subsp. strangulata]XP_044416579.1 transcription factor MYB57-like [Triticum aestivum]KAF7090021.1 hypothetical protein CFC21_092850 [Triticum aestivum]